ncbi:LacI family DNA-binding transcriptional regulator, partial [Pseudomonas monteilii]|nr:LacI family DNA-binding transcriptional regulator [Pseudomonas monteilii]
MTIKQIAEMAGVSVTTVSQILNNKGSRFSEETRKRVLDIVNKYHY